MTCLSALPHETLHQIIEFLDTDAKFRLSATCKLYRTILLPEIFNTIRFTNDEASATSALVAVEAHGQYVKAVEFTCQCDPCDEPTAPSLFPAASKILQGHLTPNLQLVRLKFGPDPGDDDLLSWQLEEAEDVNVVRDREAHMKRRALMNETWEAVAANLLVRELVLDELSPLWASTWYTDAFRRFLGQLESATLNIYGFRHLGFHSNTMPGCHDFLRTLDESFFRHMKGLKHLHLRASDPLGLGASQHGNPAYVPLALKPEDLPLLQSLKLENCFICPELLSFIQSHARVLKSLDVNSCLGGQVLPWADFFDGIYEAKPRLTELIAEDNRAPFPLEEGEILEGVDESLLQRALEKLEADPALKVFRYTQLDNYEGILFPDLDLEVERLGDGADQRAYDRLMGLVNKNRA
ncbi:hypothetical protein V8C35DRAFT_296078 [Trichoderma chlorosporum]